MSYRNLASLVIAVLLFFGVGFGLIFACAIFIEGLIEIGSSITRSI